jgi:hypothetical protein
MSVVDKATALRERERTVTPRRAPDAVADRRGGGPDRPTATVELDAVTAEIAAVESIIAELTFRLWVSKEFPNEVDWPEGMFFHLSDIETSQATDQLVGANGWLRTLKGEGQGIV